MKKIIYAVIFLVSISTYSQKNNINLDSIVDSNIYLTLKINQFELKDVVTNNGIEKIIKAEKLSDLMQKDAPEIPKFTTSLIIPDKALMKIEVLSSKFTEYQNISIAPSKGNFSRQIDPSTVAYNYGRDYSNNNFFPGELANFDPAYIMRNFRGQNIQLYPFQYNPVTKILRVYSEIKFKANSDSEGGENQLDNKNKIIDSDFHEIYKKIFINYLELLQKNSNNAPVGETGKMLIICHDPWLQTMQSFVNWKNTIGRNTTIVSVTQAGGTAANIKNYVTNYYNTNGLTFLLLVGDATQVPTNSGGNLGGDSDNAYAYILGNDKYQEFIVGRFSAETVADVNTQVARTINYEKGDQLSNNWLNKILSIASQEGPGDDNELDYEHLRNIQTDLLGFTYTTPVYELFEGSQGGYDASGFPNTSQVATALNAGAGIINYTGHGSDFSWGTTDFSNSNVLNLNNKNKLPFIFDVACVNGNFVTNTCFAESWLRAQKDGEPTGAIAIVASTINQSWNPPMIGQDEMNDIIVGQSIIGSRRTFGSIIVNGFFKMNAESLDYAMTDTWTCFGDPSLFIRTNNAVPMVVSHSSTILATATSFNVNCDFNGALATISYNGIIIGTTNVINGIANIPVSNILPGQILKIAVVGFNKVTYLGEIQVIPSTGSYLVVNSFSNSINYGETKNIELSLKNIGVLNAYNAQAVLTSTNNLLTISNGTINYGNILANNVSSNSNNSHTISVANNIQDQTILNLNVALSDNSNQYNEIKNIVVNAPKFTILSISVDDSTTNNNGKLDPGETANIVIQAKNEGHANISNVIGNITTINNYLTINNPSTTPNTLNINETKNFIFNVTSNAITPLGTPAVINFNITGASQNQYVANKSFNLILGHVPTYCDASAQNTNDEFIQRVQFNTIDNTTLKGPAYSNHTNISTIINRGQTIPITITNGAHWSGDLIGCWADWNYDGDFLDENENITISYIAGTNNIGIGTGNIFVPNNAYICNTRLRVRVQYEGTLSSCGTTPYGEVEDYILNVQEALDVDNFENSYVLFPNPTKDNFSIQLNSKFLNDKTYLEIYNTLGQKVYHQNIITENTQIPFYQNTGIYLVKIKSNDKIIVKKLIVN